MSDSTGLVQRKSKSAVTPIDTLGTINAAFNLVNSSNPINQVAHAIVRWMGREGISESDFEYCLEHSRAIAYPNERGLAIRESINNHAKIITKAGGLHLIIRGNVGRMMAFSQDYAYMVTTAAVALTFQSVDIVTKVLSEIVLAHKRGGVAPYPQYSVDRARLISVLSRVADSILVHIVNPGHGIGGLPDELKSLCVHLMNPGTFASFVLKISRSSSDVLLLCDRFQGDLFLWVTVHFEGSIGVSVAGKVLYESIDSHNSRKFTMVVKERCQADCHKDSHRVELSELLGDTWTRTLDGRDDQTRQVSPGIRLSLYTIKPPDYSRRRGLLDKEDTYGIKVLAQRMLLWLLDVPLQSNDNCTTISFSAVFDTDVQEGRLCVGDILHRSPALLHDPDGQTTGKLTKILFKPPKSEMSQPSDINYEQDLQPLSALCECFPAIEDVLKGLLNKCRCRICRNKGLIDDIKEGCLREAALNHLFMLIGNAIADGLGVQDASGSPFLDDYALAVRKILWDLTEGTVWWDYWFNLAASTALGYSPRGVLGAVHIDEGANALVAVQYGSLVVAARWLDLARPMQAKGCFALEIAEGQIPDVQEECVFLYTEVKMTLDGDLNAATMGIANADYLTLKQECSRKDQCPAKLHHAIIGSRERESKRLVTMVSSGSAYKIVDPADALLAVIRSTFQGSSPSQCQHRRDAGLASTLPSDSPLAAQSWYVWNFEDLLINWTTGNEGIYFSNMLDSDFKVNVALSLSPQGCLVRDSSSCLLCALELLGESTTLSGRVISYQRDYRALVRRLI